jgi:nitrate reductase beta subunit
MHKLVSEWQVALPLHPEYGTEPNIFYVPPLSPHRLNDDGSIDYHTPRIPPAYLESLFGPKVHAALDRLRSELATVRAGGRSDILDTLIVYRWQELFGPFTTPPAQVSPLQQGTVGKPEPHPSRPERRGTGWERP